MPTATKSTTKSKQRAALRDKPTQCRPASGAYPDVSRKLLAELTDSSESHVGLVLRGLREPKTKLAMQLAAEIGVTLDQLMDEIKKANSGKKKVA